jgi:hypothetical protein
LLGDGGDAGHVLVGRVGAAADERGGEGGRVVVGVQEGGEGREWGRKVGGEGAVEVGLELGEVLRSKRESE